MSKRGIIGFLTALGLTAQFANGQLQPDCNPLHTDCPSKKAWPQENYYIDFTKQKGPPSDWTVANSEVVNFTSNGAELSYAKKGDAPNMWTDFYMLGGRYDVEMKIAPGQGVISSAALWSDTQDEIDFEFSGNQFGQTPFPPRDGMWAFETNIFTQGKMWDGAATYQKDSYKPAEQFHKYSVEWDEDHMNWYVDDKVVRSVLAKDTPKGFAFPQSPMKLQLGVWGGGDPSNNHWTIQWAGGEVDMKGAPYTMYVKSVNITNKYPACQYRYKDKSGKQASIEKIENGCNPELVRMAKRDPAANNYPVSSPESVASEVASSTPANYPTYDASSPSTSQLPTSSSSSQSLDTYPTTLLSSSDDLPTSSPVGYPTYSAGLPSASDQSISSSAGYPTSEVGTSSIQSSSSVASGYPTSPAGSSSVVVSSSASSLAETFETYPALSVSSASVSSASASSASVSSESVSSASSLSLSSVGVPSSSTVDGYPTQPLTESGTVSTQTSVATAPGGYP
ncbi:concanavalin A-like lectin/glucanase domain-containing protein [Daldinia loculata]|nr:concanavalin A-like lectin/glucanase domain-containing protein [Daldinia loculata]